MSSNIKPALNLDDPAYLSADDFQKQLCAWLQNRGLLSELRAYFKSNMIEILRNTSAGSSLGLQPQAPSSPKMQAINLLVAEYLSHSDYHFSLCVFGTEVTLNKVFCSGREKFKFNQKEVLDILETLGIMRHNKQAKCIYLLYQQGQEPLLNYFLPTPPIQTGQLDNKDLFFATLDNDYDFGVHSIDRILLNSNISPEEVNQLKFSIKWICDKHKEKEKQLETNLKVEYKTQLTKYKLKIHEIEKTFQIEHIKLNAEISRLKQQLSESQLKAKNDDKVNKFVQCKLNETKLNETKLNESKLNHDNTKTKKVHVSVSTLNVPMQTKASQCDIKNEESESAKLKDDVNAELKVLKTFEIENMYLRKAVQKLEQENEMLRSDNHGFSKELDQLALRASTLMAELNISQQNILRLNGILHSTVDVNSNQRVGVNQGQILSYTGAGEEYLRTNNVYPPQLRHFSRTPRRRSGNRSTTSSSRSESPTENILQDARQKLKHLEEESAIIDKKIGRSSRQSVVNMAHRYHLPSTPMKPLIEFGAQTGISSKTEESGSSEGNVSDGGKLSLESQQETRDGQKKDGEEENAKTS